MLVLNRLPLAVVLTSTATRDIPSRGVSRKWVSGEGPPAPSAYAKDRAKRFRGSNK